MFPLSDENPTLQTSLITYAIIAFNVIAWIFLQGAGTGTAFISSLCNYGIIPGELFGTVEPGTVIPLTRNIACVIQDRPNWMSLVSHMFMHGSWFHIIGNLWFLKVFGDNVEDSMGRVRFVMFYLLCGVAAFGAQALTNPASPIPMVGASGAISGIMGAYAVLYPRAPVHVLIFLGFYLSRVVVPAFMMLGYWFVIQLLGAAPSVGGEGGVAFWAHVGGFVAGVVLIPVFKDKKRLELRRLTVFRSWRPSSRTSYWPL